MAPASKKDSYATEEQDLLLPKVNGSSATGNVAPAGTGSRGFSTLPHQRRSFTVEEINQRQARAQRPEHSSRPRFESLDFEEVENTVYRSDRATSSTLDSITYAASKWLVCFFIGMFTAITAFVVNLSVENISGFKFWATLTIMEKGSVLGSFLVYACMNAVLVLAAVGITLLAPAAVGSGITEVKGYLNGIDVPGIFFLSTFVAKVLGSVGAVAGGLATGKEGPFVHAGACVAALTSQGGPPGYQSRLMQYLWNDRDRADMVTAGAAAGVSAAFRSPVGGVLFALEEMSSWWRNQLMWYIFFTTAVVSVTIRILMKMCGDEHCGFFGSGGFIYFEIQEGQDAYEVYELAPMLLLGVLGGLLGASFNALVARLAAWRRDNLAKHGKRGRLLEGLVLSILTSAVSFALPLAFPCQACPAGEEAVCPRRDNSHSGNFVSFGCTQPNQYSDLATLFFNTQDDAIRALFSSRTQREYTVAALVVFVTAFYWLAVFSYGVWCPTGLFVPSILCGAAYGRLVGIFVADMYPGQHIDEGTYALLGAASFLGGSMRMTVCICVMLLELTNNLALLPLIMLVLLVAKAVGDGTGIQPIYEVMMEYKGLPFLQPAADPVMRHITARESCGRPPVTLQRVERVQRIVDVLKNCQHNGFPVQHVSGDGEPSLVGVVLRQHLLCLLVTRTAFQVAPYVTETASRVATSFGVADFSKPISTPGLSIHDIQLTRQELVQFLDLGPYLNPSYYVVQDDASLSKVYTLFRTLGLRHICVVPRAHDVVGIISREDLLPATLDERLALGGQFDTSGTLANYSNGGAAVRNTSRGHRRSTAGSRMGSGLTRTPSPPDHRIDSWHEGDSVRLPMHSSTPFQQHAGLELVQAQDQHVSGNEEIQHSVLTVTARDGAVTSTSRAAQLSGSKLGRRLSGGQSSGGAGQGSGAGTGTGSGGGGAGSSSGVLASATRGKGMRPGMSVTDTPSPRIAGLGQQGVVAPALQQLPSLDGRLLPATMGASLAGQMGDGKALNRIAGRRTARSNQAGSPMTVTGIALSNLPAIPQ